MKKLVTLSVLAFVALGVVTAPRQAEARMPYMTAFTKMFGDNEAIKEAAGEKKCLVCHGAKKTERSEFAKALGKALGAKDVKDADKIAEALAKAAKQKVKEGSDETYGDLLKAGKLPEPYKAAE